MKKSFVQTLALVAVLGGLLAWYFIVEKRIRPDRKEAEESGKLLVHLSKDQIQEIEIQRKKAEPAKKGESDYSTIQMKKVGQDWVITQPLEDAADNTVVGGLVSTLTTEKQDRVVEEAPKDLALFGLAKPSLKISVKRESTTPPETVWIGDKTPVGSSSYVRLGDKGPVYRAGEGLRTNFDKDVNAFRSKAVATIAQIDVNEMEIQNSSGSIVFKKGEQDVWQLLRDDAPASNTEVSKSLNAVTDLRALGFASEKPSDMAAFGLRPPLIKVTLKKARDKGKQTIWVGQSKGKTYAKREDDDTIYEVENETVKTLQRKAQDYRDTALAKFNRFDVSKIQIEHGKDSFELVKDGPKWSIPKDPSATIDSAKVDGLLTALQDVKIQKFRNPGDRPKTPAVKIQLFEKKGDAESKKVEIAFATPTGSIALGSREGFGSGFEVSLADFKKLSISRMDLIQKPKTNEPSKTGTAPVAPPPSKNG